MNIGVFLTYGMSLQKWQELGLLDRELKLYKEITNTNKKINIYFFSYNGKKDNKKFRNSFFKIIDLNKYFYFKNKYLKFLNSLVIPFLIKKELKYIHVLKSNQTFGSWIPLISSIIYRKKFIHRAGYDFYRTYIRSNTKISFFKKFLFYQFIKFLFSRSSHIIVTSYLHKKNLVKNFNIKKKKISIISNFVDTRVFKRLKHTKVIENSILFVGRISKEKNIEIIINGINKTNFFLNIIGNGSKKYINKLKIIAKEVDVKVNFIGLVKNENLNKYYNQNFIFINFSDYEGNPKSLMESMACGSLIICSNVEGNNEIVKNQFNGFIIKKNVIHLRNILSKIRTKKKTEIRLLKSNSEKYAKYHFDLKKIANRESKIYFKVFR